MILRAQAGYRNTLRLIAVAFVLCQVSAAEDVRAEEESHAEPKHHVSIVGGVTIIPDASVEPDDDFVLAPTLGVEYEYKLNRHWYAAVMADVEFKDYGIDTGEGALKRENVFIIALAAMYRVVPHFVVYAGPGYEIETHESFFVIRVGAKYEFELANDVEITPTIEADFKETEYASIFFGVALGKRF